MNQKDSVPLLSSLALVGRGAKEVGRGKRQAVPCLIPVHTLVTLLKQNDFFI